MTDAWRTPPPPSGPASTPAPARRSGGRKGVLLAVFGLMTAIVLGSCAGTLLYARDQLGAPSDSHGAPIAFTVTRGEGADAVASDLESKGLIRSAFWFSWLGRFRNLDGGLHPGTFMLDPGMAAGTVISTLTGDTTAAPRRVQLTEGMTADQMATRVDQAKVGITRDAYLGELKTGHFNAPFLAGRPVGASLEGFLFPDTYDLPDRATAHDLVQMQLDTFEKRAAAVQALPPAQAYAVVTLASLVEREAKDDADRPLVASVITNRLQRGSDLEIDASVLYGLASIGRDGGNGSNLDVKTDTPYNTYLHPGLPPTPIANPGVKSLEAAANPPTTGYLYYVSDGCGHNHYSSSLADHNRQVAQYVGKPCPSAAASPSASTTP